MVTAFEPVCRLPRPTDVRTSEPPRIKRPPEPCRQEETITSPIGEFASEKIRRNESQLRSARAPPSTPASVKAARSDILRAGLLFERRRVRDRRWQTLPPLRAR